MDSPAPVDSPTMQPAIAALPQEARSTTRILRSFGFHVLAVLLGIALIFM